MARGLTKIDISGLAPGDSCAEQTGSDLWLNDLNLVVACRGVSPVRVARLGGPVAGWRCWRGKSGVEAQVESHSRGATERSVASSEACGVVRPW
jgi:hypothetical protein